MAVLDFENIREELVVFLRNNDVFTITERGVTTITESFTGDGATTSYSLSNTGVRNIRSVTVNGSAQEWLIDYTVDYPNGEITFTTVPASGATIEIQYDYGSTDKIFPDFPKEHLSLKSFPRIGVDITSIKSNPAGFGNVVNNDVLITIIIQDTKSKTISQYAKNVRSAIINNFKNFKTLGPMYPAGATGIIESPNKNGQVLQQSFDYESMINYEINN